MGNVWDMVVIGIVAAVIVGAVLLSIRTRQKGRSCCDGCGQCNGCKKDACEEQRHK